MVDLLERGVITGTEKDLYPGRIVTPFALGTSRSHDFPDENPAVGFWPV
jgi:acyl-CoA hydrolase